ncbi:autotransporter assembly complex protein TamA [Pseudogemmobacter sp. W21_MBD1_M6]|uniref:autotransporter assembly complex protein TamA n=1 Tax=Pseudogemmobacter sp. W21_MBD1_M6 TaxID=3240271 RepID=UPI003F94A5AA
MLVVTAALCGSVFAPFSRAMALEAVDISVSDNNEELAAKLRTASLTLSAQQQGQSESQDLVAAALADYRKLLGTLYENGYYSGVISIKIDGAEAADISPFGAPATIRTIKISVTAGPLFKFSKTEILPLVPQTELPADFKIGEPARSPVIQSAVTAAIEGWRGDGYAKAVPGTQAITADHRAATLAARIGIITGPRVKFGDLKLPGETAVRPERIRQIAGLPTGEVFSPEELKKSADRLRRTGAFRSVALTEADVVRDGDTLDINAAISEQKPRRFGFGAEVSTLDGVALSGFWMHRNLLGGAENLRIDAAVSGINGGTGGIDYDLAARFGRPATFGADTTLYILAQIEVLDEPDYSSRQITLGVGATRIISDTLQAEAGLGSRYAQIDDPFGSRDLTLLTLPLGVTFDRRNDTLNPTEGTYIKADLTPFAGINGSASGARLYVDSRAYKGFGEKDRFVLAGRLQFGSLYGPAIIDAAPDYLFYSGGGGTVRGQPYQSLDIDLGGGRTLGGRSFIGTSFEVRAGINDAYGVVGFADAGYVGANSTPDNTGGWHSGAGLGLRYNTGIGPIRFDVATPTSGSNAGKEVQIYVGIGQSF